MRILIPSFFATGHYLPDCERMAGGAELGIRLNAERWASAGMEVHIICYHPTRRGSELVHGIRLWFLPGTVCRDGSGQSGARIHRQVWKIMRRVKPDLFYQVGAGITTGLYVAMARFLGAATVVRLANDRDVSPALKDLLGEWRYRVYLWGLRHAHQRIAQTRLQQRLMKDNLGLDSQIVPNCKVASPVREAEGRTTVVWVARALPVKRPQLFLDLARAFPQVKFTMVAPGHGDVFEQNLRQQAAALSNLDYIPSLSLEEVQNLFARARLLVSTSSFEGFPNTFLEASLQETPILSMDIDPDDYLARHGAGVVCHTAEELHQQASRLLAQDSELQEMGQRGRQAVLQEYEVESVAKRYLEVFRHARKLAGHPPAQ